MIIGSKLARAGSGGAEIPKKLLSLLMAAVLALSLAPSAAWAQPEAPAAAPTEKALTDAQTADELATSQTAQPVEEAPQLDELAPDPESADEGPEALEEPTERTLPRSRSTAPPLSQRRLRCGRLRHLSTACASRRPRRPTCRPR